MSLENCDALALIHSTPKDCFQLWGDITRAFMKKPSGAQVFTGVDAAAFKTDVETEADWDAAIAAADPDTVVGTPELTGYDLPEVGERTQDIGYGLTVPTGANGFVLQLNVGGISSEEEKNLRAMNQQPVDFALYSRTHNQLIGKEWVDANTDVFFSAYSCFIGNRTSNSDGGDQLLIKLYCKATALVGWAAYDTPFLELK